MARDATPTLTELSAIITAWLALPEPVHAGIVAMVQAVTQ